jgi:2-oxoglutarate dehydrogenase E1 component
MGCWEFVRPLLEEAAAGRRAPRYIGRPRSASPAEGSASWHAVNQRALVEEAFAARRGRSLALGGRSSPA